MLNGKTGESNRYKQKFSLSIELIEQRKEKKKEKKAKATEEEHGNQHSFIPSNPCLHLICFACFGFTYYRQGNTKDDTV